MRRSIVNMYEAKAKLSELVDRAASGDDVVIGRGGKPVALLTRVRPPKRKVKFGVLKGKLKIPADFDAPLPDEVLASFSGS